MKYRLFLGIPIPHEISQFLHDQTVSLFSEQQSKHHIRIVPIENYHITVSFFGEVEEDVVPQLVSTIEHIANNTQTFVLQSKSVVLAPPKKNPTMLWAVFDKNSDFSQFVVTTEKAVGNLGAANSFRKQHKPIPHITLARLKGDISSIRTDTEEIRQMDIPVISCYLFTSMLHPDGPKYTKLHEFQLLKL